MKRIVFTIVMVLTGTAQAQTLAAKYACSDWWGRKLPVEERTKDNCAELLTAEDLVQIGRTGAAGPSGTVATASQTIPSGTYYTATGTYQVSRSGSSTFVARVGGR
jgi:hypothetical protein